MSEANKAVVQRLYEGISSGNLAAWDALVDDAFVEHEDNGVPPTKEGVKVFFEMILAAFPDMKMVPQHMIAEGDLVSTLAACTGTHRGEFLGMPATNKTVTMAVFDLMRLRDGKVTEHWGVSDMASLMQQLGAIPEQS